MPMIDTNRFSPALEARAACQVEFSAILAEWRALPSEQSSSRSDEFEKRLDIAERPYFLACERVAYELNAAIEAAKAAEEEASSPRPTKTKPIMALQTENNTPALLLNVRASADWTRDIGAKFPQTPKAVRLHLETLSALLDSVAAFLNDQSEANGAVIPAVLRMHASGLSISIRLAVDHIELAEAFGQAHGVIAGLRIGKSISLAQHDLMMDQFKNDAQARRIELDQKLSAPKLSS